MSEAHENMGLVVRTGTGLNEIAQTLNPFPLPVAFLERQVPKTLLLNPTELSLYLGVVSTMAESGNGSSLHEILRELPSQAVKDLLSMEVRSHIQNLFRFLYFLVLHMIPLGFYGFFCICSTTFLLYWYSFLSQFSQRFQWWS